MSIDPQSLGPAARAQILRKLQEEDEAKEKKLVYRPQGGTPIAKVTNIKQTEDGVTFRAEGKELVDWIRAMEQKMKEKPPAKNETTGRGRPKMGNRKTTVNGITFDSKKEAERYLVLMDELKHGKIRNLHLQETIVITPSYMLPDGSKVRALTYVADFTYERRHQLANKTEGWFREVEDAKGYRTRVYLNKKKALAEKGIYIKEV